MHITKVPHLTEKRVGNALYILSANNDLLLELNETAEFLWNHIPEAGATEAELITALTTEYDVDPQTAQADVSEVVELLSQKKVITTK